MPNESRAPMCGRPWQELNAKQPWAEEIPEDPDQGRYGVLRF